MILLPASFLLPDSTFNIRRPKYHLKYLPASFLSFDTLIVKICQELPKLWAFKDNMIFGSFFEFALTLQHLYLTLFEARNQFEMGTKIYLFFFSFIS